MSTNAIISFLDEGNRTLTSIGLSCDGYFSHAGNILLDHYQTERRIKDLLKLGDLFALNPRIPRNLPTMKKYKEIPLNPTGRDNRLTEVFGERLKTKCIPFHYYAYTEKTEARVTKYPSDLVGEIESVLTNLRPWGKYHYVWHYRHWLYPKYNKNGVFLRWEILNKKMCETDE